MRRCPDPHDEGLEGQGEVIEIEVRPVTLESLDASGELLQSGWWGFFKQAFGWQAHPFQAQVGQESFGLLVLTRRLLRVFCLAYVPFGPVFDPGSSPERTLSASRGEMLSRLAAALRPHLPKATIFIRFDLPWEKAGESPAWTGPGPRVRKAASDMQPPATVLVDIRPTEEEILAAMKPKTRYNIRLASKKGVEVSEGSGDDFDAWYRLYRETSARDRIAIHAPAYYRGLFERARAYPGKAPDVKLLLARHEGGMLAGNIVILWKTMGIYLTGASSNERRNLMPTYALQWEAIRMARAAGCGTYDLYGVPPAKDPAHPMHGLYQFKTGFSEQVLERWGSWDVPCRPATLRGVRRGRGSADVLAQDIEEEDAQGVSREGNDAGMTVAVGMSGGVDSSVAALLVTESGFRAVGVTMRIYEEMRLRRQGGDPVDGCVPAAQAQSSNACYGPDEEQDAERARQVCDSLGIPFVEVDLRAEYRAHVLDYFSREYLAGRTPNPCVRCNQALKFGLLLEKLASEAGVRAERFATGHYARVDFDSALERFTLRAGVDAAKDQSYFLCMLSQDQLARCLFPLGGMRKSEVRALARERGLVTHDRAESQDFAGGDYRSMVRPGPAGREGFFRLASGEVVGKHRGIWAYTIGQRRGLGISGGEPLYVTGIDAATDTVFVGPAGQLFREGLLTGPVNWVSIAPPAG